MKLNAKQYRRWRRDTNPDWMRRELKIPQDRNFMVGIWPKQIRGILTLITKREVPTAKISKSDQP